MTAPVLHGGTLLFGSPDGLRAVAADDGRPLWHLREPAVGAVDVPPVVWDGVVYLTGEGWLGAGSGPARQPAAYAIRLDRPAAAPVLSAPPARLRHWPWLAAAAALAAWVVVAAGGARKPAAPRSSWPDALPVLCVLAAAVLLVGWLALHRRIYPPLPRVAWTGSGTLGVTAYRGPVPAGMFLTVVGLAYAGALLGAWRGRKLAVAAFVFLAVGAAVAVLWVRCKWGGEEASITTYELCPDRVLSHTLRLVSGAGGLSLEKSRTELPLAAGLLDARDPRRFALWRDYSPGHYPAAGPLRAGEERGAVRQWHGFEGAVAGQCEERGGTEPRVRVDVRHRPGRVAARGGVALAGGLVGPSRRAVAPPAPHEGRALSGLQLLPHRQRQRRLPRVRHAAAGGGVMSRMLRRAFNFSAAASAALLVGVILIWIGSYLSPTPPLGQGSNRGLRRSFSAGVVSLRYRRPLFLSPGQDIEDESGRWLDGVTALTETSPRWKAPGIEASDLVLVIFDKGKRFRLPTGWEMTADCRLLCAAAAVLPAAGVARRLALRGGMRRLGPGSCRTCGYDLALRRRGAEHCWKGARSAGRCRGCGRAAT